MNSTQQIWWNPNIICASLHLSFVLFFVAIIILLERLETVLARDLPSTNRAACKKHGGFEDSKETGCTPWFYTIPVKYRYKKTCTSNHFRHISPSCQTSRLVTNIQRLSPQSPEVALGVWSLDDIHTRRPLQCNYSLNHPAIISESVYVDSDDESYCFFPLKKEHLISIFINPVVYQSTSGWLPGDVILNKYKALF